MDKLRGHLRAHQTFLITLSLLFAGWFVINTLNNQYAQRQVVNSFSKNFEKQSLAQLETYNIGAKSVVEGILTNTQDTLIKLAGQADTLADIKTANYQPLEKKFRSVINSDDRFETMSLMDKDGTYILTTSTLFEGNKYAGVSFAERDYYKDTMAAKAPIISGLFKSVIGNAMVFTVPLLDGRGEVEFIIVAAITPKGLANNIALPDPLDALSFTLLDPAGNIIMTQSSVPDELINIKNQDVLVRSLLTGTINKSISGVNYLNQKTFGVGSAISIGQKKIYVASYFSQEKYAQDLALIKADTERAAWTARLRSLIIFGVIAAVIFKLIKSHEKTL